MISIARIPLIAGKSIQSLCNHEIKHGWTRRNFVVLTIPSSQRGTLLQCSIPSQSYNHKSEFKTHRLQKFSTSNVETREFQAETRKLLDIVTHSIYTDKEVFLRELISNASDAIEKYRYKQLTGEVGGDSSPLEIQLFVDKDANQLIIQDNGIGMSKDELVSNLGTIARSGSRQFVEQLRKEEGSTAKEGDGIIGQFGVGFYSSFMVSDKVSVESASVNSTNDQSAPIVHRWASDGSGSFTIEPIDTATFTRGSKITMHLKDSCKEFADTDRVKAIIKKYSSFVSFPIKVNGEVVNTVSALWLQDKKDVSETQHEEFYKFISNAYDKPRYTLHFRTDAPIDLKCLFYVPSFHQEKFGMGRTEPGVNLYSRKVLIESKPKDLLPDWLRFVKGVVDSEDLPLSLSREKPQDSHLLRRIRDVLTRKILRFFDEQSQNDPAGYKEFYIEYNVFLKEGLCSDPPLLDQLAKLLRFESSNHEEGTLVSLDDYLARSESDDKNIYYLVTSSRSAAMSSPYMETFKKHGKEVLLLFNTIDDFVMNNLKTYKGRNLVSVETSEGNLDKTKDEEGGEMLSETEAKELCAWMKMNLGDRVRDVKTTHRLTDSPAIVTEHQSASLRKMLRMINQSNPSQGQTMSLPPQVLEINPRHELIRGLYSTRLNNEEFAGLIAGQVLDNALIAAGLVDDPRSMLPRLNRILNDLVKAANK